MNKTETYMCGAQKTIAACAETLQSVKHLLPLGFPLTEQEFKKELSDRYPHAAFAMEKLYERDGMSAPELIQSAIRTGLAWAEDND